MLTLDKIYHAAFVLKDVARKTDLIEAPKLSKDCQLYLKTENLQVTGSFKVRGAYYKISLLSKEESGRLAAHQMKFIRNLEMALVRIENKTYGICKTTGKLIPKERLMKVPHATECIEAKEGRR